MGSKAKIEIIARGLCTAGSRVLLCRNVKHGYHYLPGGHVEFGEPASVALAREMVEEAGVTITVGDLMLMSEHTFISRKGKPHHELNLVFHVEHLELPEAEGGEEDGEAEDESTATPPPVLSLEPQIAFDWVELAAIPETDVRPPEIKAWLAAGGQVERRDDQDEIGWVSNCDPRTLPEEE